MLPQGLHGAFTDSCKAHAGARTSDGLLESYRGGASELLRLLDGSRGAVARLLQLPLGLKLLTSCYIAFAGVPMALIENGDRRRQMGDSIAFLVRWPNALVDACARRRRTGEEVELLVRWPLALIENGARRRQMGDSVAFLVRWPNALVNACARRR